MNAIMVCVVLPVVILVCIVYACKYFEVDIIPKDLKLPPPKNKSIDYKSLNVDEFGNWSMANDKHKSDID
jgi:hypothetical protein